MGLREINQRAQRAIQGYVETYRELGDYQRLRMLVIGFFVADVVVTGLLIFALTGPASALEVTYRADFPTRLLVVRNRSHLLTDAEVELDGEFRFVVPRLEVGPLGIDLRDFRDPNGLPPDANYQPRRAVIATAKERHVLTVGLDDANF